MSEELKPCPFCYGLPKILQRAFPTEFTAELFRVFCIDCHAALPWVKSPREAVDKWNARA